MSGGGRQDDVLGPALCTARDDLSKLLEEARVKQEEFGSKFTEEGVSVLKDGITIYADLFKRTNIEDSNALDQSIAKGHKTIKEAAFTLLDTEEEWNSFLGEIEDKTRDRSTLIDVGDVLPSTFNFLHVTTTAGDDGSSSAETLGDILRASSRNATLFVLNRHFA